MLRQTTGYVKEANKKEKAAEIDKAFKPTITCYNCRKPKYIAKECLKLITNQRKHYLSNIIKELINAELKNDNIKKSLSFKEKEN